MMASEAKPGANNLKILTEKRLYIRQKVTKLCEKIQGDFLNSISTHSTYLENLDRLKLLESELNHLNSQICDQYVLLNEERIALRL